MLKIKNIIGSAFVTMVVLVSCKQADNNLKQSEFYVRGNCGMCEERIEKSAKDLKGVVKADWDVKTKSITVSYDSTQVNEMKIQQAIANSGHETKTVSSPKDVHDALPECCKKGSSM